MEKAFNQAVKDIQETIDERGNTRNNEYEVFVLLKQGINIGLFEYHNDECNLYEEGINHFKGCVSLTQDKHNGHAVIPDNTPGFKMLMFDYERLQGLKHPVEEEVRKDARSYTTPCIFNLNQH